MNPVRNNEDCLEMQVHCYNNGTNIGITNYFLNILKFYFNYLGSFRGQKPMNRQIKGPDKISAQRGELSMKFLLLSKNYWQLLTAGEGKAKF